MTSHTLLITMLLVTAAACGKDKKEDAPADKPAAAEPAPAAPAAEENKDEKETMARAKAAIAEGKAKDMVSKCSVSLDWLVKNPPKDAAFLTEFKEVCGKQINLASMEAEVVKAEAARKAGKPGDVLNECFNTDYDTARGELKTAGFEGADKELVARFEAACPPKK